MQSIDEWPHDAPISPAEIGGTAHYSICCAGAEDPMHCNLQVGDLAMPKGIRLQVAEG